MTYKEATLVSKTQPSGPLCLWQCLHLWIESDTHDDRQDIIEALAEATDRGVIIVTCTQCSSGAVSITSYCIFYISSIK